MNWSNVATKRKSDSSCCEQNGDERVKRRRFDWQLNNVKDGEPHGSDIGEPQREIVDLTEGEPLQGASKDGKGTEQDPITFVEAVAISEAIAGAVFTELPNGEFVLERRRAHQNDPIIIPDGEGDSPTDRKAENSNDKSKSEFLYISEDEDNVAKGSKPDEEIINLAGAGDNNRLVQPHPSSPSKYQRTALRGLQTSLLEPDESPFENHVQTICESQQESPSPGPRGPAHPTSRAIDTPTEDSVRLQKSLSKTGCGDKTPSLQPSNWEFLSESSNWGFSSQSSVTTQCTNPTPESSQYKSMHLADSSPDTARVSTRERKWLFWHVFAPANIPLLEKSLQTYYTTLPTDRTTAQCWLYTGSKLPKPGGTQTLSTSFQWSHGGQRHRLTVNMGFISMMVEGMMTEKFKAGIIEQKWHASHLCGNWTCMNPRHIYPEFGTTNWSRNPCFRVSGECLHSPKCLKHLKRDVSSLRPLQRVSKDPSARESQEGIGVNYPFQ